MSNIFISEMCQPPMENQQVELVERKGIGHPDTMCDAIMEQVSIDLCKEYKAVFNRVLHHNIDKGMLIAGRSEPFPGGGRVLEMMRILFGDRATSRFDGKRVDVGGIAEEAAKKWIRHNLRFVNPGHHIIFQNELKEGSLELTSIFERQIAVASDTVAAVGWRALFRIPNFILSARKKFARPWKLTFPASRTPWIRSG